MITIGGALWPRVSFSKSLETPHGVFSAPVAHSTQFWVATKSSSFGLWDQPKGNEWLAKGMNLDSIVRCLPGSPPSSCWRTYPLPADSHKEWFKLLLKNWTSAAFRHFLVAFSVPKHWRWKSFACNSKYVPACHRQTSRNHRRGQHRVERYWDWTQFASWMSPEGALCPLVKPDCQLLKKAHSIGWDLSLGKNFPMSGSLYRNSLEFPSPMGSLASKADLSSMRGRPGTSHRSEPLSTDTCPFSASKPLSQCVYSYFQILMHAHR